MIFRNVLRTLAAITLLAFGSMDADAQRKLPTADEMLSVNGAQGREFWIAIPPNEINPFRTSSLEVYVASAYDTEVFLLDAAGGVERKYQVTANNIRTLSDLTVRRTGPGRSVSMSRSSRRLFAFVPTSPSRCTCLNAKVTTSDGYLAIPTSVWGKHYIVTTYYDFREFRPWACGFTIIAKYPGTVVDIALKGTGGLDASTSGGKRLGQRFQISMEEGDIYHVKGDGTTRGLFDLTGTEIRSNQPIGMISSHQRTTMPNLLVRGNGRDHLVEMSPPVETWGKKYVSVEYNRAGTNHRRKVTSSALSLQRTTRVGRLSTMTRTPRP